MLSVRRENLDQCIPNPCNNLVSTVLYLATCITVENCENKTLVTGNQNYPLKEQTCHLCRCWSSFVCSLSRQINPCLEHASRLLVNSSHVCVSVCLRVCFSTNQSSNGGRQIWGGVYESGGWIAAVKTAQSDRLDSQCHSAVSVCVLCPWPRVFSGIMSACSSMCGSCI